MGYDTVKTWGISTGEGRGGGRVRHAAEGSTPCKRPLGNTHYCFCLHHVDCTQQTSSCSCLLLCLYRLSARPLHRLTHHNLRVLFDAAAEAAPPTRQGSAGPLDPADPRVRRVPFVTQRPTFSELKRVLWVLGSVRKLALSEATEQQGAAAAAATSSSSSSQGAADQQQQEQQQQQQEASAAAAAAAAAAAVSSPLPPVKKQVGCGGVVSVTGIALLRAPVETSA